MQEVNKQPPPAPPAAKSGSRKKILIWILVVLGFFLLLIALIIGGSAYYGYTKMKEMGLTPAMLGDDPGTAFGKIVEATNEEIEFVSSDPEKGIVTFRNKKTGETVTVDFESIKAGEIPEILSQGSGEEPAGEAPPEEPASDSEQQ